MELAKFFCMLTTVIASLFLTSLTAAAQSPEPFERYDQATPAEWKKISQPDPNTFISLTISLHPADENSMEQQLLDVSDPSSPNWRSFISAAAATKLLAPADAVVAQVLSWLNSAGINGTLECDGVVATTTVENAQRLLSSNYSIWDNGSGSQALRTDEYYIPDILTSTVRYVSPGVYFPVSLSSSGSTLQPSGVPDQPQVQSNPYKPQSGSYLTHGGLAQPQGSLANSNTSIYRANISAYHLQRRKFKARPRSNHRPIGRHTISRRNDNSTLTKACLVGNSMGLNGTSVGLGRNDTSQGANSTGVLVTPDCYRAAYGIDLNAIQNPSVSFAIIDTDTGMFSDDDLQIFLQNYAPKAAASHPRFGVVAGKGDDPSQYQFANEPNIDTQTSMGLVSSIVGPTAPGTATFYGLNLDGAWGWTDSSIDANDIKYGQRDFLTFLRELVTNDTVPSVVSLSAGANEGYVPVRYARRACLLIGAAGARGVTFLASSGDSGPLASTTGAHANPIDAQFPAACPWVLAVGATANPFDETALTPASTGSPNVTFTSGGGFSNIYPRPAYQKDAVGQYVDQSIDAAFQALPGFNATGRGYPDVAALGWSCAGVFNGQPLPSGANGGTSVSTPAWAAMIALLNAVEQSKGRSCLGFINPLLYSLAARGKGLRDISTGNGNTYPDLAKMRSMAMQSGAKESQLPQQPWPTRGYNASAGWDALTGLGVPIWADLMAAIS